MTQRNPYFAMPANRKGNGFGARWQIRAWLLAVLALSWPVLSASDSAVDDAVFWQIERQGQVAGYLLGTIHSEDPRVLEYPAPFMETLTGCDTYAMELVPDLPTMNELMAAMRQPLGEDLARQLGQARFERVVDALSGYGVNAENARGLKPWAVMMMLSMPPPKSGLFMDFSLSLRAAGAGLEVVGLETIDEQLSFLEALDLPAQIEMLDQAVADVGRVQATHTHLVDTYLSGSLARLQAEADEEMDELSPATRTYFQREGIDRRNAGMLESALPLLEQGCTFIAVGALHLPGPSGLVQGLRAAGFQLSSMTATYPPPAGSVVRP